MKRLLVLSLVALSLFAATRITRASVSTMEKSFDRRLERDVLENDPFLLLGMTRGVYAEGFGVVFSTEVDLAPRPGISPFHPEMTKQDWERIRQKKLQRLTALRSAMKQMLLDSAASLDGLTAEERVVLGVSLTRHPNEDVTGIPSQIVMQALKRNLIDVQAGRRDRSQLDAIIKVQEF